MAEPEVVTTEPTVTTPADQLRALIAVITLVGLTLTVAGVWLLWGFRTATFVTGVVLLVVASAIGYAA